MSKQITNDGLTKTPEGQNSNFSRTVAWGFYKFKSGASNQEGLGQWFNLLMW